MSASLGPHTLPASLRRAQPWLGTLVAVEAAGLPPADLERAVVRALRAVARVHARMSVHDPASELSCLNREAHRRPVQVSGHLWRVLGAAQCLSALSGGLFDPTVGATLVRWGYLPSLTDDVPRGGDWRNVVLGPARTVRFERPLLLDLGGIAKGYAVDLAIGVLRRAGVPAASVNAGGDMRFYGPASRQIYLRDPARPDRLHALAPLTAAAVATSCAVIARRRHGSHWRTPLVDPRHVRGCAAQLSVSVIARSCLWADALTKPLAIAPEAAAPLLHRLRARAVLLEAR